MLRPALFAVLLPLAALPLVAYQAAKLEIVKPTISEIEDSSANAPLREYRAGQVVYFTCRVAGFTKAPDDTVHIAYTVQAFDQNDVPLAEIYKDAQSAEVTPQDKEWMPKIETAIAIPPLVFSGKFKIVVKAQDAVGKTSAEASFPFQVRGASFKPVESLSVTNFHFLRNEEDTQPVEHAAYRPGDHVWAKFDIAGYKFGEGNHFEVSYLAALIGSDGKTLWKQTEPAGEQGDSFYPKAYVSTEMGITLDHNIKPGEYTLSITAKDTIGKKSTEYKGVFTVEQ